MFVHPVLEDMSMETMENIMNILMVVGPIIVALIGIILSNRSLSKDHENLKDNFGFSLKNDDGLSAEHKGLSAEHKDLNKSISDLSLHIKLNDKDNEMRLNQLNSKQKQILLNTDEMVAVFNAMKAELIFLQTENKKLNLLVKNYQQQTANQYEDDEELEF